MCPGSEITAASRGWCQDGVAWAVRKIILRLTCLRAGKFERSDPHFVKTHADTVDLLKTLEATLKDRFAVTEMGLVSTKVEYKPVAAVRLFVVGPEPDTFGQLAAYLAGELDLAVEVIPKANANGFFRYVFAPPRQ